MTKIRVFLSSCGSEFSREREEIVAALRRRLDVEVVVPSIDRSTEYDYPGNIEKTLGTVDCYIAIVWKTIPVEHQSFCKSEWRIAERENIPVTVFQPGDFRMPADLRRYSAAVGIELNRYEDKSELTRLIASRIGEIRQSKLSCQSKSKRYELIARVFDGTANSTDLSLYQNLLEENDSFQDEVRLMFDTECLLDDCLRYDPPEQSKPESNDRSHDKTCHAEGEWDRYDVFLSYCHEDKEIAKRLEKQIGQYGISVRRDDRDEFSQLDKRGLADALKRCSVLIVLWSPHSIRSDWVLTEARQAMSREKYLGMVVEECQVPSPFEYCEQIALDGGGLRGAVGRQLLQFIQQAGSLVSGLDTLLSGFHRFWSREIVTKTAKEWKESECNTLAIVGHSGLGKSSLMSALGEWMTERVNYDFVCAHSFDYQSCPDEFFEKAIRSFDNTDSIPACSSFEPGKRGALLARKMRARNGILLLDGLDNMAYSEGDCRTVPLFQPRLGQIKDSDLRSFIKELAKGCRSRCVVTSRTPVTDLQSLSPSVYQVDLSGIDQEPGETLFENLAELNRRSIRWLLTELNGHAMGLEIAVRFLAGHGADRLKYFVGREKAEDGLRLVLGAIESYYFDQVLHSKDSSEVCASARNLFLLYSLGLFGRPVPADLFAALHPLKQQEGTLGKIFSCFNMEDIEGLKQSVKDLARLSLLKIIPDGDGLIACHRSIAEYFRCRLEYLDPDLVKKAHQLLYDYYRFSGLPDELKNREVYDLLTLTSTYRHLKDDVKEVVKKRDWPKSWEPVLPGSLHQPDWALLNQSLGWLDMSSALLAFRPDTRKKTLPLFQAIAHGCLGRKYNEALSEVYFPRVSRGSERFAELELGLKVECQSALSAFFEVPFSLPLPILSPLNGARLLDVCQFWKGQSSAGAFSGEPVMTEQDPNRRIVLLEDFGFNQASGAVWIIPAGTEIWGSFIPTFFWPMTGSPFEGPHRNAFILYDYYCHTKIKKWEEVNEMFLDACLAGGVNRIKAKQWYALLYLHGSRWGEDSSAEILQENSCDPESHIINQWIQREDPEVGEMISRLKNRWPFRRN